MKKWMRKGIALILFFALLWTSSRYLTDGAEALAKSSSFFETSPVIFAKSVTKNPKILLIGNSLTYYNDMPNMLKKLCKSSGINATVKSVTVGACSLSDFLNPKAGDKEALNASKKIKKLLKSEKWDYVILQDRRYEAVRHPASMRSSIRKWKKIIEQEGAQMVLYMTWAPKSGHSDYARSDTPSTRDAYQKKISDMYVSLAKEYGAALSPVGTAFTRGISILDVNLYQSDKLHPSKAGSYLAACVLYGTLFGKSPENASYSVTFSGKTAAQSQTICKKLRALAADVTVRGKESNTAQISFSSKSLTLRTGQKQKLSYSITGNTKAWVASFKSSNSKVVSVDSSGNITANKAGTAKITVRLNNNRTASISVTVQKATKKNEVLVTKIAFKDAQSGIKLKKGATKTLTVQVSPQNVTKKTLRWSSSNKKILTVSQSGKIKAKKKGTAVITVQTTDGSNLKLKLKVQVV